MKRITDDKIIKAIYENIRNNAEFPTFGSPETKCNKCMFCGVACQPLPEWAGCFAGWKYETEGE